MLTNSLYSFYKKLKIQVIKETLINTIKKFCGKCGALISDETIRFCGECGTAIVQPQADEKQTQTKPTRRRVNTPSENVEKQKRSLLKKPEPIFSISEKPARECDSFLSKNSIGSGLQWAVIWLIGWLPIGVLFSWFYDSVWARNPTFYSKYPRTWDTTLPGMLTTYGIGSLLGGFIAGLLMYRILNKKELSMGGLGAFPALSWGLLWGGVLAIMTILFNEYMDDGTLIITIPIFALIFGGLVSRFSIMLFENKYAFLSTKRTKMFIAACWSGCSLLGVIMAMIFSGA